MRAEGVVRLDAANQGTAPVLTDRDGHARFDLPPASGKVLVDGRERYQGRLAGEIPIELWSISQFPRGGPQQQGNRLAVLPRTKGEH